MVLECTITTLTLTLIALSESDSTDWVGYTTHHLHTILGFSNAGKHSFGSKAIMLGTLSPSNSLAERLPFQSPMRMVNVKIQLAELGLRRLQPWNIPG